MKKETLHMTIGSGLGEILLDIAQTKIMNGDCEKGIETYTESLNGFTKEYALMCLMNKAVLVVDEENQVVDLRDDPELLKENAHLIYNWDHILKKKMTTLTDIINKREDIMTNFHNVFSGDIENYSLHQMMLRYFSQEQLKDIGYHNIAAAIIASPNSKAGTKGYDNPQSKWDKLCDKMENYDNPDVAKWEKVLYYTVEYVKIMKYLHKDFVSFDKLYHFLINNGLTTRIPCIEPTIENICSILKDFSNTSNGYCHPMCNIELYNYKEKLAEDLANTIWGKEFLDNGILKCNIMDGYDAGWLSPEGDFYGDNGPTGNMIHMTIADQIFNTDCNPISLKMTEDGVSGLGVDSPEYWLEKHGWIKIHHQDCYGSFIGRRNEKPTKDFPYAYNPTEVQIKMICDYADKFYGGKFYTEPDSFGRLSQTEPFKTYAVRQMDEFGIHKVFGYY